MIGQTVLMLKLVLLAALYVFLLLFILLMLADLRRAGRTQAAESAGAPRFYLAAIGGEGTEVGHRFLLGEEAVLGRDPDSDIQLDDASVSSQHARLRLTRDGYVVEDLGSTNGTLLNGAQVSGRASLRPGDKLKLGRAILQLEVE